MIEIRAKDLDFVSKVADRYGLPVPKYMVHEAAVDMLVAQRQSRRDARAGSNPYKGLDSLIVGLKAGRISAVDVTPGNMLAFVVRKHMFRMLPFTEVGTRMFWLPRRRSLMVALERECPEGFRKM